MNKMHIKKLADLYNLSEEGATVFYQHLQKLPDEILEQLFNDGEENISYKGIDVNSIMQEFDVPHFEALIRLGACMIDNAAYEATLKCVNYESEGDNLVVEG